MCLSVDKDETPMIQDAYITDFGSESYAGKVFCRVSKQDF